MSIFRALRVRWNIAQRLGAYRRARAQGLSDDRARAYSDELYPPTAHDLAFEASLRDGTARVLPIASMLALLYPLAAALYVSVSAPLIVVAGYALANLAYVLFGAALFKGTFLAFGLRKRGHVFVFAVMCFVAGVALCNVRT